MNWNIMIILKISSAKWYVSLCLGQCVNCCCNCYFRWVSSKAFELSSRWNVSKSHNHTLYHQFIVWPMGIVWDVFLMFIFYHTALIIFVLKCLVLFVLSSLVLSTVMSWCSCASSINCLGIYWHGFLWNKSINVVGIWSSLCQCMVMKPVLLN